MDSEELYTTIPYSKLKDKLRELVQLCFIKKNGQRGCKYLVLGMDRSYFCKKKHSNSTKKFSETDIIKMLELLIDNIFVFFGGRVGIKKVEIDKRSFLKLSFANDDINLDNILHHKSVESKIPPYFKDQSVPIISYVYTRPIASKCFNYKHVLHNLNIDNFKSKSPDCTCASSPFIYNPTGHVITGDLKIINNTSQREVFAKRA